MFLRRALLAVAVLSFTMPVAAATVFVDLPAGASIFCPHSIAISAGDTVTWRNPAGGGTHGVAADDSSFSFPATPAPWTYSVVLSTPGAVRYYSPGDGAPGGLGMSGIIFVNRTSRPATEHILQMNAWDFQPVDGASAIFTNGVNLYNRRASAGGPSGFAELLAGLHLPSGTHVTAIELAACDTDSTAQFDAAAQLIRCVDPNDQCLGVGQANSSGAPGCGFFIGNSPETIDNLAYAYFSACCFRCR